MTVSSARCRYAAGEPATFHYEIAVSGDDLTVDVPASKLPCACDHYSEDPLSFVQYRIEGTSAAGHPQLYCEDCDTGCCRGHQAMTVRLTPGTRTGDIKWSGRTWRGPSDTSNRQGPAFEPGSYAVIVRFSAFDRGAVVARLPLEIVAR